MPPKNEPSTLLDILQNRLLWMALICYFFLWLVKGDWGKENLGLSAENETLRQRVKELENSLKYAIDELKHGLCYDHPTVVELQTVLEKEIIKMAEQCGYDCQTCGMNFIDDLYSEEKLSGRIICSWCRVKELEELQIELTGECGRWIGKNASAESRSTLLEGIVRELVDSLEKCKQGHYECEDCWYSCPKSEEGCCDDRGGEECNCGADKLNVLIDAAVAKAKEVVKDD